VYISHLRRKIEWDPGRPAYVLTERGVGYRFAGQRRNHQGQAA
jgi:two-component system KDP operon response regulator KdpE